MIVNGKNVSKKTKNETKSSKFLHTIKVCRRVLILTLVSLILSESICVYLWEHPLKDYDDITELIYIFFYWPIIMFIVGSLQIGIIISQVIIIIKNKKAIKKEYKKRGY